MKVELCPKCGASKIETDILGINSKCLTCGWAGMSTDLIVSKTDLDRLGIAETVSVTFLKILAEEAAPVLGRCMVLAGLVGGKEDKVVLARVIKNATVAAHKATLETLEQIQKEQNGIPTA